VSEDDQRELDDSPPDVEQAASRIAQRGRDALLARLRPAFHEAAAAHADLLELSDEQLEELVQRAADEADGLQWRRALAAVAAEELEISLGEALGHPAVARAHQLLGAPSYEDSLAALTSRLEAMERRTGDDSDDAGQREEPLQARERQDDTGQARERRDDTGQFRASEADTGGQETDRSENLEPWQRAAAGWEQEDRARTPAADGAEEQPTVVIRHQTPGGLQQGQLADDLQPEAVAGSLQHGQPAYGLQDDQATGGLQQQDENEFEEPLEEEPQELRIAAIHLGGIANLSPAEAEVELRLAEPGLDIIRANGEVLGRLEWEHIEMLEVPEPRRRLMRSAPTHLVLRTARGDASFEVPGVEVGELRDHLAPILALYLPSSPA
jgi:hypothetical protein